MKAAAFALGLLLVVVVGCASYTWATVPAVDAFRASGLERASFELNCPKDDIAVRSLNSKDCKQRSDGPYVCSGAQIAVDGCCNRTTYVFPKLGHGDDWLRNSAVLK